MAAAPTPEEEAALLAAIEENQVKEATEDPDIHALNLGRTVLLRLIQGILGSPAESGTRVCFRTPSFAAAIAHVVLTRCGVPRRRIRVVAGYETHPDASGIALPHVWLEVDGAGRVDVCGDHPSVNHVVLGLEVGTTTRERIDAEKEGKDDESKEKDAWMRTYIPLDTDLPDGHEIAEGSLDPMEMKRALERPSRYIRSQEPQVRRFAMTVLGQVAPWKKPPDPERARAEVAAATGVVPNVTGDDAGDTTGGATGDAGVTHVSIEELED